MSALMGPETPEPQDPPVMLTPEVIGKTLAEEYARDAAGGHSVDVPGLVALITASLVAHNRPVTAAVIQESYVAHGGLLAT